jgi:hypothetical protein
MDERVPDISDEVVQAHAQCHEYAVARFGPRGSGENARSLDFSLALKNNRRFWMTDEILNFTGLRDTHVRFRKEHLNPTNKRKYNENELVKTEHEIEAGLRNYAEWLRYLQTVVRSPQTNLSTLMIFPRCKKSTPEKTPCPTPAGEKAWKLHILYTYVYRPESRALFEGSHLHRDVDILSGELVAYFRQPLSYAQILGEAADKMQKLDVDMTSTRSGAENYFATHLQDAMKRAYLHAEMDIALPGMRRAVKQVQLDWDFSNPPRSIYADEQKASDVLTKHDNNALLREYQRWWIMRRLFPACAFPMLSPTVDDIWHMHLALSTETYERECAIFFPKKNRCR